MASAALPSWPPGTTGILCVEGPHAIPVSTAVRAGDTRLLFALGRSRATLERLRENRSCALCLLAPGLAFTAAGAAELVREPMRAVRGVVALSLAVRHVQDHLADGRTEIVEGVSWKWRDATDAERDAAVVRELLELAAL